MAFFVPGIGFASFAGQQKARRAGERNSVWSEAYGNSRLGRNLIVSAVTVNPAALCRVIVPTAEITEGSETEDMLWRS